MRCQIQTVLNLLLITLLSGCSLFLHDSERVVSSSLVDYLYPKQSNAAVVENANKPIPHLELPIKVGIAFVPHSLEYNRSPLSQKHKDDLLNTVKKQFSQYDFIHNIEVIPSNYLKKSGGFNNLKQIGRIFDVDLMALVSYDQVQRSFMRDSSFLYLTIVGAYVFKGDANESDTFVDTSIFDLNSETLLMRAAGVDSSRENSTALDQARIREHVAVEGFTLAMQDMTTNLDSELGKFVKQVRNSEKVKIDFAQGYTGGGSIGWMLGFILLVIQLFRSKLVGYFSKVHT